MITSIENFPLITIIPNQSDFFPDYNICLAFDGSGSGHYDALVEVTTPRMNSTSTRKGCTCGKSAVNSENDSKSKNFCVDQGQGYMSRCQCLRSKKECGLFCKCKGCKNPHGVRQPTQLSKSRKRKSCEMGGMRKKGEMFLKEQGEDVKCGQWTEFESLLLLGSTIQQQHLHPSFYHQRTIATLGNSI